MDVFRLHSASVFWVFHNFMLCHNVRVLVAVRAVFALHPNQRLAFRHADMVHLAALRTNRVYFPVSVCHVFASLTCPNRRCRNLDRHRRDQEMLPRDIINCLSKCRSRGKTSTYRSFYADCTLRLPTYLAARRRPRNTHPANKMTIGSPNAIGSAIGGQSCSTTRIARSWSDTTQ